MRRFLVFFLTMILLTSNTVAQKTEKEERKVMLRGQVFDSFTRNYLDSAMVTVMTTDSTVIARDTIYTRRSGTQVWVGKPLLVVWMLAFCYLINNYTWFNIQDNEIAIGLVTGLIIGSFLGFLMYKKQQHMVDDLQEAIDDVQKQ